MERKQNKMQRKRTNRTYVVAPGDGRVPGAADSSTVARSRPVGRLSGNLAKVVDALLDLGAVGAAPAAEALVLGGAKVGALVESVAVLGSIKSGKLGFVVGVDGQQLLVDALHGAVELEHLASGRCLDFPLDGLDGAALERVGLEGGGLRRWC